MPTPRLTLVLAALAVSSLAVDASLGRLCQHACTCRLTLTENATRLHAHCPNVSEFPSLYDANVSVILLRLGDGRNLKELADFHCDNCQLDDIDREAFEGLSVLDAADLVDGVLVQVPTDVLEGESGAELQLVRSDIFDCDEYLKEFVGLRPKVKVIGCGADLTSANDTVDAGKTPDEKDKGDEYDDRTLARGRSFSMNDTAYDDYEDYPGTGVQEASPGLSRRDETGDLVLEDGDETTPRLEGVQPMMPTNPVEDPVTVFGPWTIAVIAGVGAIIVAVAGYYIWQKWTEIRSCCCGGEYSQP